MTAAKPETGAGEVARGALFVLLLTVFVDMVGFGIIIPFLPFWAENFNATPDLVAMLMATYSACQFIFAVFWGALSDRWGRKPILLISLLGSVISFIWIGFAESLWVLFAARALAGSMGGNIAVAHAYIADLTPVPQRARAMGFLGAAFGLGFILGPAVGGLLAGSDPAQPDFRTPFLAAAGVSFLSFLLGLVFLREPVRHSGPARSGNALTRLRALAAAVSAPAVARPILLLAAMAFVMSAVESTFALWTERQLFWGPREIGWFFAYIGVVLVAVQGGLVGPLVRRVGEARLVPPAIAAMAVGVGMVPVVDGVGLVLVSGALIASGIGLGSPTLTALISRAASGDRQGAILGASQSAQSLARIFGPTFAGILFAALGRDIPYIAGAAILLLAFGVSLGLSRRLAASGATGE